MLKVLSLYDSDSATDGIIFQGIKNILSAIDKHTWKKPITDPEQFDHQSIDTSDLINDQFRPNEKFDIVLVPGTPWLWDHFHLSHKYRNLRRMLSVHSSAKIIFFGIGSALNINAGNDILSRPDEKKHIYEMTKNALVIVRDNIAHQKVIESGVKECYHLPCPAYFCYGGEFQEPTIFKDNVLIWYNPLTGISRGFWNSNKVLFNKYMNTIKWFYNEYNPKVYTVLNCPTSLEKDIKLTKSIGIPNIEVVKNNIHTKEIMKNANVVLSGRVHCAVPAYVQGKATSLMRIDSRANVLTNFGGTENGTFCTPGKKDFSQSFQKYLELIKRHIGA